MKNKKIEEGLNRAIEKITPDVYPQVASSPIKKMVTHDYITLQSQPSTKASYRLQLASAFAVFIIVFGIFIGWTQIFQTYGFVDLDVNPSIEIRINRQNRVIEANALDLDGVQILSDMNLRYVKIENAVDAILGSMVKNGYLTTSEDAMLVSVVINEPSKAEEIENTLIIQASSLFSQELTPHIYSQHLQDSEKIRKMAEEYKVSRGVINLIILIQEMNSSYTTEELIKLPIKQLYELAHLSEDVELLSPDNNEIQKTPSPIIVITPTTSFTLDSEDSEVLGDDQLDDLSGNDDDLDDGIDDDDDDYDDDDNDDDDDED